MRHVVKDGRDAYLLFNEEKTQISARLRLSIPGRATWVDPERGERRPLDLSAPITVQGHQLAVLIVEVGEGEKRD